MKYSPDGSPLGQPLYIGDSENPTEGCSVLIDQSGCVYLAGIFSGTVDFSPGLVPQATLTSAGGYDIFIMKFHTEQ